MARARKSSKVQNDNEKVQQNVEDFLVNMIKKSNSNSSADVEEDHEGHDHE